MNAAAGRAQIDLLAFTGRFQPFHLDHLAVVNYALERARHVLIGITNAAPGVRARHPASAHRHLASANPFSYAQRERLIAAALRAAGVEEARCSILPFPLDEPARWPNVLPPGTPQLVRVFSEWEREKLRRFAAAGYPPLALQGDVTTRICATQIRRCMATGEPWQHWVPAGARELLGEWLARTPGRVTGTARRSAGGRADGG